MLGLNDPWSYTFTVRVLKGCFNDNRPPASRPDAVTFQFDTFAHWKDRLHIMIFRKVIPYRMLLNFGLISPRKLFH